MLARRLRRRFAKGLSLLLVLCLLTPTANAATGASHDRAGSAHRYNGRELVVGLFFGQGPVAKLLPELWSDAPPMTDHDRDIMERVLSRIERTSPTFFSEFESAIYSRDHFQIQRALEKAAQLIMKAFEEEGVNLPDDEEYRQAALYIYTYGVGVFAVALVQSWAAIVATGIYAVQVYWKAAYVSKDVTDNAPLRKDMVVQWIAERVP